MSQVEADIIHALGAIMVRRPSTGVVDIPASGILSLNLIEGSAMTLGGGGALELRGVELLDRNGTQAVIDQLDAALKTFRAAPGVKILVRHNATEDLSAQAIPAQQRIYTTSQNDFEIRQANVRGFFTYVDPVGDVRWVMNEELSFDAADPGDWPTSPTSVIDALDYLGASVASASQQTLVAPKQLALNITDDVYLVYPGPSAKLLRVSVVLDGALTALTSVGLAVTIDGQPVTDGDISVAAGEAGAGSAKSSVPSANNDLVQGSVIRVQSSALLNLLPTRAVVTFLVGPG